MKEKNKEKGFWPGVFWGALVGAGLAYFLNFTKEGKKIQKELKRKIGEVVKEVSCWMEEWEKRKKKSSGRPRFFTQKGKPLL